MPSAAATRINLLARKEQVRSALEGATLLQNKRDALLEEFLSTAGTLLSSRTELESRCREAANTLNLAIGHEGREALRSAGMASKRSLDVETAEKRVWGIPVPHFRPQRILFSPDARGYSLPGTGILVDETAAAFEKVLEQSIESAMEEVRLRRIGMEIRKTSRRVNALEQILIPSLRSEIGHIRRQLEERAREDVFRLKRLKAKKSAKKKTPIG